MKIKSIARNPYKVFSYLASRGAFKSLDDKLYLQLMYRARMGEKLNLENPISFNEKMQWLKLNERKPLYTILADKIEMREYLSSIIGDQYLVPLIGIWDTPDQIDFENLPEKFVIKCNHNSGLGMCICTDKNTLDFDLVRKDLMRGLNEDYYLHFREWPYRDIRRRIICEKYLTDESGYELKDYKVFVLSGEAKYVQVDYDRFTDHHRNFYDSTWTYVPFTTLYPTNPDRTIEKPQKLNEMLEIAEFIANKTGLESFVRIDFYAIYESLYIGEITMFHGSGYEPFFPSEYDVRLGRMIKI